jgi:hypothetical protein
VYEFEGGRVYAISDVTGGYESFFLDSSPTGDDVFFATADHLLERQDTGNNLVVFDARVNGGFPAPTVVAACSSGEGCLAARPPGPEGLGPSGSATFSGPGNLTPVPPPVVVVKKKTAAQIRAEKLKRALKACRRDKSKHKRVSCERTARRRYGPVKAKAKKASGSRAVAVGVAGGEGGAGR